MHPQKCYQGGGKGAGSINTTGYHSLVCPRALALNAGETERDPALNDRRAGRGGAIGGPVLAINQLLM